MIDRYKDIKNQRLSKDLKFLVGMVKDPIITNKIDFTWFSMFSLIQSTSLFYMD